MSDVSVDTLAERLRALLAAEAAVRVGYVFGSRVEGEIGPLSDTDVGVLVHDAALDDPTACRARLVHEIRTALDTDAVDLVFLDEAPIELADRVLAQGTQVHEKSRAIRVEYEATCWGDMGIIFRFSGRRIGHF